MNTVKLEKLLENAAKNPAFRPDFYDALRQSDLVVPYLPDKNQALQNGEVFLKQDTAVKVKELVREDGQRFIPIFTSVEALQKGVKTTEAYLQLNAKTLFEITKGASYVLNPYSNYAKEFSPEEIESLMNHTISEKNIHLLEKDAQILVGQPKDYPHLLIDTLKNYFSKTNNVNAAYLAQIFVPNKDEKPHLMVGVDMYGDNEKILKNSMMIAQSFLNKEEFIDFLVVEKHHDFVKDIKPFFQNTLFNRIKNTFLRVVDL